MVPQGHVHFNLIKRSNSLNRVALGFLNIPHSGQTKVAWTVSLMSAFSGMVDSLSQIGAKGVKPGSL
jgi:hypothetical protein